MDIREAMKESFDLGLLYGLQVESCSLSERKQSHATRKRFDDFVDKICNEPSGFYLHSSRIGGDTLIIGTINGKPIEDTRVSCDKTFYAYNR